MKWIIAAVLRATIFLLLWVGFSQGNPDYWGYGLISVAVATALSLVLLPPVPVSPAKLPRILVNGVSLGVWFLKQSIVGGIDVALRALKPRMDIDPIVVQAPLTLPPGASQNIALILMNLMPGSMVQRLVDKNGTTAHHPDSVVDHVELHSLSEQLKPADQWAELQKRCSLLLS